MATDAQAKGFLGITDSQLAKAVEYLDKVSPQVDENGDPRSNDVNDFGQHAFAHYNALIRADLKQQQSDPEWD